MPPIIANLSRKINQMKWMNTFFFAMVLPFMVILFGNQDIKTLIMVVALGLLLGVGNHLFVRNFQLRKAGLELMASYDKVRNEVLFDELTGLYSRRAGMERLREEFARAYRNKKSFSVAMVDVDHFKKINDTYGHLAGDQVLKEIATVLKRELRQYDVILRYGGEEFMVIMPDTDKEHALYPLQRLNKKMACTEIQYNGQKINVSVSIGVASTFGCNGNGNGQGHEDVTQVVERADQALYDAKRSGRNRVVYGDPRTQLNFVSAN